MKAAWTDDTHIVTLLFKKIWTWLRWHWLIKLYRQQMYNSIICHLYIVLFVYHSKSNNTRDISCIWVVCLPLKVKFPAITIIPPLPSSTSPHPPFPLIITALLSVYELLLNPFNYFTLLLDTSMSNIALQLKYNALISLAI